MRRDDIHYSFSWFTSPYDYATPVPIVACLPLWLHGDGHLDLFQDFAITNNNVVIMPVHSH